MERRREAKTTKAPDCSGAFKSAQGGIRTRTPFGATPSRWCVYQFHHLGFCRAPTNTPERHLNRVFRPGRYLAGAPWAGAAGTAEGGWPGSFSAGTASVVGAGPGLPGVVAAAPVST